MTPLIKWAGIALLITVCLGLGFDVCGHHESKVSAKVEAQANVQQVAATQSAGVGATHDTENTTQAATVAEDYVQVAADLAHIAHKPRPVPPPGNPAAPDPQPVVEPLAPVDDGKDQLIADLTKTVMDQKAEINTLTLSRDSWKTAYGDAQKEADLREIALRAQIAANKSSKWVGRIEGFAVGAAIGYAGGKL